MKTKIFFWFLSLVVVIIVSVVLIKNFNVKTTTNSGFQNLVSKVRLYPKCPANLAGLLTYPLMDPQYIGALTPLGNVNPPGHTSPVDHVYFETDYNGHIPMGAPADSFITQIITISKEVSPGNYEVEGYVLRFVVCDGLELDFANYNDVVPKIKDEVAKRGERECKRGIVKDGHGGILRGSVITMLTSP